jgi:hypothetical protein
MRYSWWIRWVCLGIGIIWSDTAKAQFFEAKVVESGLYKLSLEQVKKLGFSNLSEVAFFGYPGMLPQKLDSLQLELQEIPALTSGNELLVFLHGPHRTQLEGDKKINYQHHYFSDTLRYLVGKKTNPKRIAKKNFTGPSTPTSQALYKLISKKEEKSNILESGREWYSQPIRQGQSLNLNFGLKTNSELPWLISGRVMAQSTSPSTMRMLSGNNLLQEFQFSPIPTNIYGVKGDALAFQMEFKPIENQIAQLRFTFQGSGSNASGYLDYVSFAVPYSAENWKNGIFTHFQEQIIQAPIGQEVLEISDFYNPVIFEGNLSIGKNWVFFSTIEIPILQVSKSSTLNLRQSPSRSSLLIISPLSLLSSARKLQSHKQARGIPTSVVNIQDIYDSFGYGNKDLTAIRNFIAWEYHHGKNLKNVLLMGKGTFDYKGLLGGRPNLIPVYTSRSSLNPLTSFSSDDYFALLAWGQGEWEESREGDEMLQIGIGRIPAINFSEANEAVDKIIHYESSLKSGNWQRNLTFLADDGDNNIHLRDAENHTKFLEENYPDYLSSKLYLDRFEQTTTGNVQSSIQTKSALNKAIEEGTLLLNYIGHGNVTTLTAEEIFKVSDLQDWPTQNPLPIWMTATCEFGRFDSPLIRSAAEELLFAKKKGAISLLTTGRPVFSSVNFSLNQAFIQEFFKKENGLNQDLGTIYKNTKNKSQNGPLNRNFALLGDPSLKIPIPDLEIKITEIKSREGNNPLDSLLALQEVLLKAEIKDPTTGSLIAGFNGEYEIELRDKPYTVKTLGNESSPAEFKEESNVIFRGKGKVVSGQLESSFFISKNIEPEFGMAKIRLIAWDEKSKAEASGAKQVILGGESKTQTADNLGPTIKPSINGLNSPPFTFPSSSLQIILDLEDSSGVNTSNFNPNQLLSVQVNNSQPIYIGELFVGSDGGFKKGILNTQVSGLIEGINNITFRAWDNQGNGSTKTIEVEVKGSNRIQILSHKVFPNPASEKASFEIVHNRANQNLLLTLEIYSSNGSILFSERIRLVKAPEKIEDLTWKFFQNQTKFPAKGTYIYKLRLQSELDNSFDFRSGKLVIE